MMEKLTIKFVYLTFLSTLLGGCSSVPECLGKIDCKSSIYSSVIDRNVVNHGVIYAIPKQDIIISIVRSKVTEKSLKAKVDENEKTAKAKAIELKKVTNDLKAKKKQLTLAASKPEVQAKFSLEISILEIQETILKEETAIAQKTLLEAKKKLLAFTNKGEHFEDSITLKTTELYPDHKATFTAKLNKNHLTSETVELKTTPAGLLTGGTGKSEGQLDEIIVSAISAIKSLGSIPEPSDIQKQFNFAVSIPTDPKCSSPAKEETFEFRINLDDTNYATNLKASLDKTSFCYYSFTLVSQNNPLGRTQISGSYDGLVYPRKRLLQFNVNDIRTGKGFIRSLFTTYVDPKTLGYISLDKGYFATNDYEFEFTDGMLTRYKAVKPNEIVEMLSLIPEAAKAIISIPAEILQLKIDYSSKEESYWQTQKLAYDAHQEYLNREDTESSSN